MVYWILLLNLSFAEYRAFELVIHNNVTQSERIEVSTLDPLQYTDYYPVQPNEVVMYRETWMCYGQTSFQKICPNPRLEEKRLPASQQ